MRSIETKGRCPAAPLRRWYHRRLHAVGRAARVSRSKHSPRCGVLAALFWDQVLARWCLPVLWLRMLGSVFGVTVYAASAVWAVFMAGLGIGGAYRPARQSDAPPAGLVRRLRDPDRRHCPGHACRAGVAAAHLRHRISVAAALTRRPRVVRILLAFVLLIVPTVLMGTTLPLVVKGCDVKGGVLGGQVGLLSGSNATGAIVGTLVAGLYPGLHSGDTGDVPGGVGGKPAGRPRWNGARRGRVAGAARTGRTRRWGSRGNGGARRPGHTGGRAPATGAGGVCRIGVISMALEVVWFRVLTLFLRPTVYGFSVMLATALTGISLGSYIVTPLLGRAAAGCWCSPRSSWPSR